MTETLPGEPHQEADAGAPFHSKLGSVNWASQLIGPWAKLQQSEDVSTTVKTLKKTLVGLQRYSVHVSQPHSPFLLAGIQVPQHQKQQFQGWPRFLWELALPPARRAKTLVCHGPRLVLVPPSSKGGVEFHFGLTPKIEKLQP